MLISIDESGSFVRSSRSGSWCVVAGYTFPERRKTANLKTIYRRKTAYGRAGRQEIKLRELKEIDYFQFLGDLQKVGGALFAVATDGALAETVAIERHRTIQAEKIRSNVPRMKFEEGRLAVRQWAMK